MGTLSYPLFSFQFDIKLNLNSHGKNFFKKENHLLKKKRSKK
ncbi:hypothetical protein LBBP_03604 [Leptospira borgpetersenii serovar Ballum]|uniref:Uncharacterized protein n=1 Tax=Leptospira borgpetersenii serovar Ballum TaxID=280505 RepID=A0A0S2IWB8_LEPBO|nr:hypothetical protein LBBP_03604 [Leptospira borgpetersenii serovar Ballum]